MWTTIVDKMSNFFGGGFFVVYWGPVAFGVCSLWGVVALFQGLAPTFGWLGINLLTSILVVSGIIMIITILSYLLASLHRFLVRIFEGYWPKFPGEHWLMQKLCNRQKQKATDPKRTGFLHYPADLKKIKPTRLGNILAAAEEYPHKLYRIDVYLWWPRLVTLLPETLLNSMSVAEGSLISLLNMSAICAGLALVLLGAGGFKFVSGSDWQLPLLLCITSGVVARVCYAAALSQAEDYGEMMRTAFDLHRNSILKQMRIPLPTNLVAERELWPALYDFVFLYTDPWKIEPEILKKLPQLNEPFYYTKDC